MRKELQQHLPEKMREQITFGCTGRSFGLNRTTFGYERGNFRITFASVSYRFPKENIGSIPGKLWLREQFAHLREKSLQRTGKKVS